VRESIAGWDGRAGAASRGLPLLAALRQTLFETTIGVYLAACREADEEFAYTWGTMDAALRALLTARLPETLPGDGRHAGWDELVLDALEAGADRLRRAHPRVAPERLAWGSVNRADIQHPLARAVRRLRALLSMPRTPLAGCHASIRVAAPSVGAAIRLVLSPAHPEDGIVAMACGQSGNPFSRHYRDLHAHWLAGRGLPYEIPRRGRPLMLVPPDRGSAR
jgi:penicillin amidase